MTADLPQPPTAGRVLRVAREALGLSSPAVATATGVSKATISNIENGYQVREGGRRVAVTGKAGTVARLAAYLGVTPAQLTDAGRADASEVLQEILRRDEPPERPAPLLPACNFERAILASGLTEDEKREQVEAHREEEPGHTWCRPPETATGTARASLPHLTQREASPAVAG